MALEILKYKNTPTGFKTTIDASAYAQKYEVVKQAFRQLEIGEELIQQNSMKVLDR